MPQKNKELLIHEAFDNLKSAARKLQDGNIKSAKLMIEQVLSVYPAYSNALYIYSLSLNTHNPVKAKQLMKKAYSLNHEYYEYLKDSQENIVQDIEATIQSTYMYFKDINSNNGSEWVRHIDIFLKARDFDTANLLLDYFNTLHKPKQFCSDENWSNLGVKCFQLGRYQDSIDKHLVAVNISPRDVMYYNNLATLSYAIGDYTTSQEHLEKTLELEPNRNKSSYLKSFIKCKVGLKDEALQLVTKAVNREQDELFYRIKLILVLLLHFPHRKQEIKQQLSKALQRVESGRFTKYYLFAKQDFPQFVRFISENFEANTNSTNPVIIEKWKKYLSHFDDFLLLGLRDKLKIKKQMCELNNAIAHENILQTAKNQN